jgi:hypothetical protein
MDASSSSWIGWIKRIFWHRKKQIAISAPVHKSGEREDKPL